MPDAVAERALDSEQSASSARAAQAANRRSRGLVRPWRLVALVSAIGYVISALHPIRDVDLYWHVLLGGEILRGVPVSEAGADWSFGLQDQPWTTTQWLSEVLLHAIHNLAGWEGITAFQVLVAAALAAGLAGLLLKGHSSPWAPAVYALTLLTTMVALQERPQLVSLLLLLWLSAKVAELVHGGSGPRPLVLAAITVAWANLHGLWILVPSVLGLVMVGSALDRNSARARTSSLLLGISLLAGCATPVGWTLLLSPFRFAGAAEMINEWQPTAFNELFTAAFAALAALLVLAWSRSRSVPWSELVYSAGIIGFALMAYRNVPPACILLAPVVLRRLELVLPREDAVASETERRVLSAVAVALTACLPLTLALRAGSAGLAEELPVAVVQRIAQEPGDHRVINEYDLGGAVLFWGGPRTTVSVDGRADRYGSDYIRRHQQILALRGGWQRELTLLSPNYALLERDTPLVGELERRGWTRLAADGRYLALQAPADEQL